MGTQAIKAGETPSEDGGFRRMTPSPEPLAVARMRALWLDATRAATQSLGERLQDGLVGPQQGRFLVALCGTGWNAGVRRDSGAARRLLQRRLRTLGAPAVDLATAASLPVGTPVHVRGVARLIPPSRLMSHIWAVSAMDTGNVRWLDEEGHDFLLTEPGGQTAHILCAGGYLLGADRLQAGDPISVFGFVDQVTGGQFPAASSNGRGGLSLALRSGDALPLLVRVRSERSSSP